MHRHTNGQFLHVAIVMALLLVSCSRQPRMEPKKATPSTPSPPAVGTSGRIEQEPSTTAAAATPSEPSSPASVERDADAIKALERMGSYLRTLKSFQIRSETSRDEVLEDGQKVEFGGIVDMLVQRPNRLRAEVTSDKQHRMYFDDGATFSVWAKRVNYYASIPAPATLSELADTLADKYDIELPLVDLFHWGESKNTDDLTAAMDIGLSQVDGITCEHYAFRQDGADWQVWIQQGDYPLPRKLVITTTTDPARPQYASTMTWNLAPSYNDAAFTFIPPKDAKKIALALKPASGSN